MVKAIINRIIIGLIVTPISVFAMDLYEPEAETYSRLYISFPQKIIGIKAHASNSIESSISTTIEIFLDDALLLNIPKNGIGFSVDAFLNPFGYEYKIVQLSEFKGPKNSVYYQWYTQ